MRFRTFARSVVIAALLPCLLGCATYAIRVSGPRGKGTEADLAIRELVIRNIIAEYRTPSPVFVSFGEGRIDPPTGFLDRLGSEVVIKPISEYAAWQEAVYEQIRETRDSSLGVRTVLAVHIIGWANDTQAEVGVWINRGTFDALGIRTTVTWKNGEWSMDKARPTTTT